MTRAQFGVLNRLARLQAKETISEIAKAFDVAQPTMSSTVARLIDKNYVETVVDPQDGRRKIVRITQDGLRCRAEIVDSLKPLFSAFSSDDVDAASSLDWGGLLDQLVILRARVEKF